MSRRDTIIVAVLVNVVLLMILFATAVHSDNGAKKEKKQLAKSINTEKKQDRFSDYVAAIPETEELISLSEESDITAESADVKKVEDITTNMAAKPAEKAPDRIETHCLDITVKRGDVLEKIARANHSTVSLIMQANNLNSTQLRVGQVLKVPIMDNKKGPQKESVDLENLYYTVKEGDSPWLIASKNQIRLEDLLLLNSLDEGKARRLKPGDKLRIK